jgi:hypothetical protein
MTPVNKCEKKKTNKQTNKQTTQELNSNFVSKKLFITGKNIYGAGNWNKKVSFEPFPHGIGFEVSIIKKTTSKHKQTQANKQTKQNKPKQPNTQNKQKQINNK